MFRVSCGIYTAIESQEAGLQFQTRQSWRWERLHREILKRHARYKRSDLKKQGSVLI